MQGDTALAAICSKDTFRFCVQPSAGNEFPKTIALRPGLALKRLPLHKDSQSYLKAKKKNLTLVFDPPTGNFKLTDTQGELLTGNAQTGKFASPSLIFRIRETDMIYGLGAASDKPNRNDQSFRLMNLDTLLYGISGASYSTFPFFIIRREKQFLGVFVHNTYPMKVAVDNKGILPEGPCIRMEMITNGSETPIDMFVFQGSLPEILEQYAEITGSPFLPPVWSLGYHQCRWSYISSEKVLEIAKKFREHHLPIDSIFLDIDYMEGYKVFTWNSSTFPDPKAMHAELKKLGIRTVAIVDPGVKIEPGYSTYDDGKTQDVFCKDNRDEIFVGKVWPGMTSFPDFSNEQTTTWWAKQHKRLFDVGVSGIWNDMNEPVFKVGSKENPLDTNIQFSGSSYLAGRNLYANWEANATRKAFEFSKSKERHFTLTRSAFSGMQRFSAIWTGDNHSTWESLRDSLYRILNLSLSGMPFCGADVGGFARTKGILGLIKFRKNQELFARWMEMASLLPFFRNHTSKFSFDQEPWSFGDEVLEISRKHIRRRYRLMPYIYSLFVEASRTGAPIVRPLFYDFPNAQNSDNLDQFMLGPDLFVSPVIFPKQHSKKLQLPPGEWIEFETGEVFPGEAHIEIPTKLGVYPLFIRSGAALPFGKLGQNAIESMKSLTIEIHPASKIYGRVTLDDGISTDSAFTDIIISGKKDRAGNLQIQIEIPEKKYDPPFKTMRLRFPKSYRLLEIKNKKLEGESVSLVSEDRSGVFMEYEIPLAPAKLELPFRSWSV